MKKDRELIYRDDAIACCVFGRTALGLIDELRRLPVIETRGHGYWVKETGMSTPELSGHYRCSVCGEWALRDALRPKYILSNFCPNCGKCMQEEEKNAND